MVNQVFKGDIIELSMGKETPLKGQGTNVTSGTGVTAGWNTANGGTDNTTTINVGAGMYWVTASQMEVPDGMLVGATLRIYSTGSNIRYSADHYPTTKRTYYITANSGSAITITPRLATTGAIIAHTDDYFIIDGLRVPTLEAEMSASDQRIKTDQFLGLLNSFSLPEPEIDVRKQHIVGMGRDVNILTSGKETLGGGSFDLNAHSLKMWKYALGGHTARSMGEFTNVTGTDTVLADLPLNIKDSATAAYAAHEVGATGIDITITGTSGANGLTGIANTYTNLDMFVGALSVADDPAGDEITLTDNADVSHESAPVAGLFKVLSANGNDVLLGYYTAGGGASTTLTGCADIDTGATARAQAANVPIYLLAGISTAIEAGEAWVNIGATNAAKFALGDYIQIYDKDTVQIPGADVAAPTLQMHEIRRVIAIGTANGQDAGVLYVEEPFLFSHAVASCGVERLQYTWDGTNEWERGSPAILSTGELKYGVEHNFFGYSTLPTFCIEQSFRSTDATPGANQLLRVFSGCKAGDLTLAADSEGELKVSGSYESTRMFTDTGSKFITPHRMFENTANTQIKRKVSGIAVNGEKPYLFQHMQFSAFGASVLRAKTVEMNIANSNTAQWYIRGTDGTYADADQVQEGSTQYASEITEAKREYTFKFSALVEDDRWFDQLRKRTHHINSNDCTLTLNKPGSHATRQRATITIEDYTVTKAEHPMPDDKGPVTATVEFAVRHLKVNEHNPYFTI